MVYFYGAIPKPTSALNIYYYYKDNPSKKYIPCIIEGPFITPDNYLSMSDLNRTHYNKTLGAARLFYIFAGPNEFGTYPYLVCTDRNGKVIDENTTMSIYTNVKAEYDSKLASITKVARNSSNDIVITFSNTAVYSVRWCPMSTSATNVSDFYIADFGGLSEYNELTIPGKMIPTGQSGWFVVNNISVSSTSKLFKL